MSPDAPTFHAFEWLDDPPTLRLLDQTRLPAEEVWLDVTTTDALVAAIRRLAVRGAPLLGACGAFGVALAVAQAETENWDAARLASAIEQVRDARPTAVNLAWGVEQVRPLAAQGHRAVATAAQALAAQDEAANRALSRLGADWLLARSGRDRLRVLTHCNSGALATCGWGTAYGIVHELHVRGRLELAYADETRPLLQGARLTSWELTRDKIPHLVQPDGAASSTILRGLVDAVVVGADRIAANGDTANKVGTVALALACARAGVPFVVAAPASTVDLATPDGDHIPIEERDAAEVTTFAGLPIAPAGARAHNPAFDVTPADLIDAIVTQHGIVEPSRTPQLRLLEAVVPAPSQGRHE